MSTAATSLMGRLKRMTRSPRSQSRDLQAIAEQKTRSGGRCGLFYDELGRIRAKTA